MDIRVLGPLEVRDDEGALVNVPGGQQRALLTLLALSPGVVISTDRLVDELWSDAAPRQPANALHIVVSKLRRAVGATVIERRPPGYCLATPPDSTDAWRFEQLVGEANDVAAADPARALELLDAALGLWRGEALDEFAGLRTVMEAVGRLDEMRATTVEQRLALMLQLGRAADVVHDAVAVITQWPYRERLRAHHMLALYRCGRQADALRAFSEAREVLAEELGLDPGPELRALEAAILAHDPSLEPGLGRTDASPTRSLATAPVASEVGNVRAVLTRFVGRQIDLTAVGELIEQHRLVTLTGPGGCGKTRLAIELACGVGDDFRAGTWFVALDSITSGDEMERAVALALGFDDADMASGHVVAGSPLLDRLAVRFADCDALLVLDNCEHVIDAAATFALELVERIPRLTVIATSREPLRVPGEAVWPVPPLDGPSASELFADRARAVSPKFDLTEVETEVDRLCADLDGMPLAIELLAARANAFTVAQMQQRLDTRLDSIGAGARGTRPRHRTLRAVTDWSHDLLFEAERVVFRRLGVFSGGCTLEAAESICAGSPVAAVDVADTLARLVDKSLVVADDGRYRMLNTLAEYARARLDESGELGDTSARAAGWFGDLAFQSFSEWRTPGGRDQAWWMRYINADLDNVRRSLEWSIADADAGTAGRLAGGLGWYWWHTGRAAEGVSWLERVLALDDLDAHGTRGLALTWLARLRVDVGDHNGADVAAEQALAALGPDDDPALESMAEFVLFRTAVARHDPAAAAEHAHRSTTAQARVDRPWNQGITAVLRAAEATLAGDHTAAEEQLALATDRLRGVGDVAALVLASHERIRLQLARQAYDEADRTAQDALALAEQHDLRGWIAVLCNELGAISHARGDLSASEAHHRRALFLARQLGLPALERTAHDGLARLGT